MQHVWNLSPDEARRQYIEGATTTEVERAYEYRCMMQGVSTNDIEKHNKRLAQKAKQLGLV